MRVKAGTYIPTVPERKDVGDRTYKGAWCSDEQGTPADFTNITADVTVYAVYTAYYTVTLEGGTGYTLTTASGSTSPGGGTNPGGDTNPEDDNPPIDDVPIIPVIIKDGTTFLGICCFIWLAVIAAGVFVAVIAILMRKKKTEKA